MKIAVSVWPKLIVVTQTGLLIAASNQGELHLQLNYWTISLLSNTKSDAISWYDPTQCASNGSYRFLETLSKTAVSDATKSFEDCGFRCNQNLALWHFGASDFTHTHCSWTLVRSILTELKILASLGVIRFGNFCNMLILQMLDSFNIACCDTSQSIWDGWILDSFPNPLFKSGGDPVWWILDRPQLGVGGTAFFKKMNIFIQLLEYAIPAPPEPKIRALWC